MFPGATRTELSLIKIGKTTGETGLGKNVRVV